MKKDRIEQFQTTIDQGPYSASWDSLENYTIPEWFKDAKFGIFIHWGVYSVPAFGSEWYPRNMYIEGHKVYEHHRQTYGDHAEFGYKDFIPMFKAERFDPAQWAQLFQKSGAKYVVPVAEHHDGFQMYDSALSKWNSVQMGPNRDIVGELSEAIREVGLKFGVSSHRAENWFFYDGGRQFTSDVQSGKWDELYGPAQPAAPFWHDLLTGPPSEAFLQNWLARTAELTSKYSPDLVWFDWWIEHLSFKPYLKQFWAYYYNLAAQQQKEVVINYKYEAAPLQTAVLDIERGQLAGTRQLAWQTDTSIAKNSWSYTENNDFKTTEEIVQALIDIVSKNGNLLLNIGPKADGTIAKEEEQVLLEIGKWLDIHGEAIFESRPWIIYGEGPNNPQAGSFTDTAHAGFTSEDVRYTVRDNYLYASVMKWPANGQVRLPLRIVHGSQRNVSIMPAIEQVELLGHTGELEWKASEVDGLIVTASNTNDTLNALPRVLKLKIK
ncbi:alpha-L-fucosidase [Paenibacillus yanchengensis]|uniref:alpha-L-fucosidase n=1 Tax=Paenibacillus yanchengensis TaxID=2035833 RepID=A0ABW4YL95_9BACL